jgi:hypothetical protein
MYEGGFARKKRAKLLGVLAFVSILLRLLLRFGAGSACRRYEGQTEPYHEAGVGGDSLTAVPSLFLLLSKAAPASTNHAPSR